MSHLPLADRRILVTRAAHQVGKLSSALRALGAEPVEVPVLEIRPPATFDPLDRALLRLETYDWLILTSANTVSALVERAATVGIAVQPPSTLKIAAIGPATASAARDAGFQVTFVPESYVAESLLDGLHASLSIDHSLVTGHDSTQSLIGSHEVSGHDFSRAANARKKGRALAPASFAKPKILIARAAVARDVIPDTLRASGAVVDVVEAYQNVLPESAPELLRQALTTKIDAATFTSSSAVTHLVEAAQKAGIAIPLPGIPAISIGPITTQTLRDHHWPPAAEATPSDIPGLVAAVARVLAGS